MGFWLVTARHGAVAQDLDITQTRREKVSFGDLVEGRVVIFTSVEMLNDELDSSVLGPNYRVLAIFILLNRASKLSDLAEGSFQPFLEYRCDFTFGQEFSTFARNVVCNIDLRFLVFFKSKE